MKKILFIFLIAGTPLAQTVGNQIGSNTIWADSLLAGRTSRIVTFNTYYPHIDVTNQNKSASIIDTIKIESGTQRINPSYPHNIIDTTWASFDVYGDFGTTRETSSLTFAQVAKEYTLLPQTIQFLKFTLLNKNTSAKYYFRVRGSK